MSERSSLRNGRTPAIRRAKLQVAFLLPNPAVSEETGDSGILPKRSPPLISGVCFLTRPWPGSSPSSLLELLVVGKRLQCSRQILEASLLRSVRPARRSRESRPNLRCRGLNDRYVLYSFYLMQSMFADRLCNMQGPTESPGQRSRRTGRSTRRLQPSAPTPRVHGDITSTHGFHTEPFSQALSNAWAMKTSVTMHCGQVHETLFKEWKGLCAPDDHSVGETGFNPRESLGGSQGNTWRLAEPLVRSPRVQYRPDLGILLFFKKKCLRVPEDAGRTGACGVDPTI